MMRVISNLFLLLSVFIFPPYITAVFLLISIFIFENFIEAVVFGYFLDIVYGGGKIFSYNFHYIFTILLVIVFLISLKLKTMLKFYSR